NIIQATTDTSQLKLTTNYRFDFNDNNELVVAPNGDSTKLIYDQNDFLVEEQYGPLTRAWTYFDDGSLNTVRTKNGVAHWSDYYSTGSPFEGKLKIQHLTELFYDNTTKLLNRRKRFNVTHHYTYDPLQRITGIQFKDSLGTSLAYASEVKYEYNNSGFQTKIDIPEVNKHFRYVPDSLNRVSEVYDWNNTLLVKYTYRGDGAINTEQLGNGATVFYHYDIAGRLDSMYAKSSSGTLLYSIGATLDDKGNHIAESYYVSKGSLPVITAPFPQTTINYQYDSKTNRLTKTNNLTATSDNNGNILQDNYTGFGITGATTTYDLFDNITRCNVDGYTHNFKYDPLDIRYSVDTNTYINDFLNNGNVLVQKRTGIDVQKLYCHSPLGLVCSIDNATNQRRWYLYDFRGSTVAILNDNQTVVEYYKYESFGSVMESSHTPGTTTPFLYVGRHGVEYQSPHLYYMRARYYDPINGRFYGEDPVWNTNLFVYANNNPATNIDPFGNTFIDISKYWRPDNDGRLNFFEAYLWRKIGNGKPLYVDINTVDLRNVNLTKIEGTQSVNLFSGHEASPNLLQRPVFGQIFLTSSNGMVTAKDDTYNFEMHKPYLKKENLKRNVQTMAGRIINGKGKKFDIKFYGQINSK
ncbi:MAG: hypothetical protein KGZ74_09180, partial [Chitinophagaceae bacterium]|nr:hypothetical protein [Chitinophagaceae bacterium]